MSLGRQRGSPARRGSILAGAMAIIFMLLCVVLVLHHYTVLSRQSLMTAEAELRFREGVGYILAKSKLEAGGLDPTKITDPPGLKITADAATNTTPNPIEAGYGKHVFDRKLPNLEGQTVAPGHRFISFKPNVGFDKALDVWGKRTYDVAITMLPGYAAFAPKGSIDIKDLRNWSNPGFSDKDPKDVNSTTAYSGVPAIVAAENNATSVNVIYGELHVINGTAKITGTTDTVGTCYKDKQFLLGDYSDEFITRIVAARDTLAANAAGGDKSSILVGDPGKSVVEAVIGLIFGGDKGLESFLSVRNSMAFEFPVIPQFSLNPPYYFNELYFSVPFPPDGQSFANDPLVGAQKALSDKAKKFDADVVKKLKADLDKAQADLNADPNNITLQSAFNQAKSAFNSAMNDLQNLENQLQQTGKQLADLLESATSIKAPATRHEEKDAGAGDDGITGWNYSDTAKFLGKAVLTLFGAIFHPKDILHDLETALTAKASLVHFGREDRKFEFLFDDNSGNMQIGGTLTVPRGRTMKFHSTGDVIVQGDIWVQRGATLVADCKSLTAVGAPNDESTGKSTATPITKFFHPYGRIFLEEGASLICTGDVTAGGQPEFGSVVVCGVPSQIHPITSAIFAKKVTLPFGLFAGSTLDDMAYGLGQAAPDVAKFSDKVLGPLMSMIAPNAGKIVGPFTAREPYFAKYATSFQFGLLPTLFGIPTIPYVTPIPLPHDNLLCPVARGLGYAFSIYLNLNLGENFYTNTDWWIFGDGVVPIMPQINPDDAVNAIKQLPNLVLDALNPSSILNTVISTIKDKVIAMVVETIMPKILSAVLESVVPYADAIVAPIITELFNIAEQKFTAFLQDVGPSGPANPLLSSLLNGASHSEIGQQALNLLTDKLNMVEHDLFMKEYNGLLVYATDAISIGGNVATGMFVAENDINISATRCAGTLLSHKGNITCKSLMYYPYFNQASLYLPKKTDNLLTDFTNFEYAHDTQACTDILPPAAAGFITSQGWSQ